jgi:hypothetical protein
VHRIILLNGNGLRTLGIASERPGAIHNENELVGGAWRRCRPRSKQRFLHLVSGFCGLLVSNRDLAVAKREPSVQKWQVGSEEFITRNPQPATRIPQPATRNPQPVSRNPHYPPALPRSTRSVKPFTTLAYQSGSSCTARSPLRSKSIIREPGIML